MTRQEARKILEELTKGESLLRHARSVELVMEAYAYKLEEDPEEFVEKIAEMVSEKLEPNLWKPRRSKSRRR